jgi:hypothetical protein
MDSGIENTITDGLGNDKLADLALGRPSRSATPARIDDSNVQLAQAALTT